MCSFGLLYIDFNIDNPKAWSVETSAYPFSFVFSSSAINLLNARNLTFFSFSLSLLQADTIVVVLPLPATAFIAILVLPFSISLKMSNFVAQNG